MTENELDQRIAKTEKAFREWLTSNGYRVSPDGRVGETLAADLLTRSPKTLSNMRSLGMGPSFYKAGGRIEYRVQDLAKWLETNFDQPQLGTKP